MLLCPVCGRELSNVQICKCGTDLGLLQQITTRADHLFNQALEAYESDQITQALEYLRANAELVPTDIEACVIQANLLAKLERWDEADTIIQHLQQIQPDHPNVKELNKIIREAKEKKGDEQP